MRLLFCRLAAFCADRHFRPVSDRLDELRRQRALVQQHLAWLDAEIARTTTAQATELTTTNSRDDATALRAPSTPRTPEIDVLLAAQSDAPANSAAAVKRGCFIAFGLLFLLLALAVTGLYFYSRSRH